VLVLGALVSLAGCALPSGDSGARSGIADILYDARRPAGGAMGAGSADDQHSRRATIMESVLQNGRIHLGRCLQQALTYNLDVSIAKLDAQTANARIETARAEFDPEFGATVANFPDNGGETSANGAIHKKFVTGTDVRVEAGTVAFDNTDRTSGSLSSKVDLAFRVRQPLLKGASVRANMAGIRAARIIAKNADATSEAQILEMLRAGESLYWSASFASQLYQSQKEGLARAERVLALVNSRREAGASTKIDVLEAESAVAAARDAVGRAHKQYLDTVSLLWQVAGFDIREPESGLVFASLNEAPVFEGKPDPESSYAKASRGTPVAILLANQVALRGLAVDKARNNVLPRLDLEVNVGTGDLFSFQRLTTTAGGTTTTSTGNWNVLLRFSVPWTFRAERAELQAARAELEKSELARTQALRELKRQIYETCREIESERTQLEAASYGTRVNRAKWEEQFRRYEEGLIIVRDLMEAESAYRQSEVGEFAARLRLILASVLLAREEGTLPERHHYVL
jgi:outer membrane protein TolC